MLPGQLEDELCQILSRYRGEAVSMFAPSAVGGGSINHALKIRTTAGHFFLKYNDNGRYPGMFEAEAKGLKLLSAAASMKVPEVIATGISGNTAWLLLEYLETGPEKPYFWEDFGQSLAALHAHSAEKFGLDHDNYIGSLAQSNKSHDSWVSFFTGERLIVQTRLARDAGLLDRSQLQAFDRLYIRLDDILPEEPPALLHGDLWSGNYLSGAHGKACLIDPAVYYGHREMDIAMTRLFGGFHFNFYAAYTKSWPLEAGWQARVEICNLYPLLVHLNLFGSGYLGSIQSVLRKF